MSRRLLAPMLTLALFTVAAPMLAERAPLLADREPAEADVTFPTLAVVQRTRAGRLCRAQTGHPGGHRSDRIDPNQLNRSDLGGLLPATSAPAVRYPQLYGLNGRALGLDYEFKYLADAEEPAVRRPVLPLPRQCRPAG